MAAHSAHQCRQREKQRSFNRSTTASLRYLQSRFAINAFILLNATRSVFRSRKKYRYLQSTENTMKGRMNVVEDFIVFVQRNI